MRDPRAGLDEPVELAVGQVDGVGQHGPLARGHPPGRRRRRSRCASGNSRATSAISPRSSDTCVCQYAPVGGGERRGLAQQVGRARDGEPRRDGVAQAAVVGAVPALDEAGALGQRPVEDGRRVDGRVVGDRGPSSPCRRSPGSRAPRRPGTSRRGSPRRPRRRRARSSCRRAAKARHAAGASRSAAADVEAALEREDVALQPGQQVEAGTQPGVRELRQVGVEIDHARQEDPWPQVDRRRGVLGPVGGRPGEGDPAGALDDEQPVGLVRRPAVVERRQQPRRGARTAGAAAGPRRDRLAGGRRHERTRRTRIDPGRSIRVVAMRRAR